MLSLSAKQQPCLPEEVKAAVIIVRGVHAMCSPLKRAPLSRFENTGGTLALPPSEQGPPSVVATPKRPRTSVGTQYSPPPAPAAPPVDNAAPVPLSATDGPATPSNQNVLGQHWVVEGNDPNDGFGRRLSVLDAVHSAGKTGAMVANAFPHLDSESIRKFLRMPADDIFKKKKGGKKLDAIADAWSYKERVIRQADEHGENLRVWCCGGGGDRIVQSSVKTGWVDPEKMRPLSFKGTAAMWDSCGIRKSPNWEQQVANSLAYRATRTEGCCGSVNLKSSGNGTGTYRAELWRRKQLVCSFMFGVYPHPGSLSWGDVDSHVEEHCQFLRSMATGTPLQTHVIKFDADVCD